MWNSLNPEYSLIRIVWLKTKINILDVNQIKYKKQFSLIKSKQKIESNQIKNCESYQVETGDHKNCLCQWWGYRGIPDVMIGGLLEQRCNAHSDCDVRRDSQGRRCSHRHSHRYSMFVKRSGFHVMVPRRGSLGTLFISVDWQVRVFWSSSLLDWPSVHMYYSSVWVHG